MPPLQAHCHLGLGTLFARANERHRARPELAAAAALYRSMDMPFWLTRSEAVQAEATQSGRS